MFPKRYFPKRYFTKKYWPPLLIALIISPVITQKTLQSPVSGSLVQDEFEFIRRDDNEITELLSTLFQLGIFDE